jgi:hypothetical protein
MNFLEIKRTKVHPFLYPFFGRDTTGFDVFAILLVAVSFAASSLFLYEQEGLSILKKSTLALLALDLGGGVVSNMTSGTKQYYDSTLKKKYLFPLIHLLQSLLLAWVFPKDLPLIMVATFFTMISSILVLKLRTLSVQRVAAISLSSIGILLFSLLPYKSPILKWMFIFYILKLVLSFSVNWTKNEGNE